jgi:hypothetical protein
MWISISVTFRITKPANTANLVGPWLKSFSHEQSALVTIGVAAFCWALWLNKNDIVFQKSKSKSILQVMFREPSLSREVGRSILKQGCHWLETCALEFLKSSGWNVLKCIQA